MNGLGFRGALIAATVCFAAGSFQPAVACSLVHYADNGRYVGGSLVAQIAAKADLIQLVRVTEKRIVTRTYSRGSLYLQFGDAVVPTYQPEYVDHFVFTLTAADTLKGKIESEPWLVEEPLRVVGYDSSVFGSGAYPVSLEGDTSYPNSLPDWVFERPADEGYAFSAASEDAGLGGGECSRPYFLEVGQLFVALRMSDGRLYPSGGGFPLEIDVELTPEQGSRRREQIIMQALIPISSANDPIVVSLREAIAD